jgi:FixJ family two-component response regulator
LTSLPYQSHAEQIEVLVTDLVLPGMTGKELSDQIQARNPRVKTVFLSGYSEDVVSSHGVLDPGVHFIQKPFDRATLARKLREAIEGS